MNKPGYTTLLLLASTEVGSGHCLSAVLLLSHRRGGLELVQNHRFAGNQVVLDRLARKAMINSH